MVAELRVESNPSIAISSPVPDYVVLSKAQILDRVWKYDFQGQSNIVELYIGYLRKKVDSVEPKLIHTIRGAGYVIKAPRS